MIYFHFTDLQWIITYDDVEIPNGGTSKIVELPNFLRLMVGLS